MVYQSDFVGVIICIGASIISNLGVNVQKYSHNHDEPVLAAARDRRYGL